MHVLFSANVLLQHMKWSPSFRDTTQQVRRVEIFCNIVYVTDIAGEIFKILIFRLCEYRTDYFKIVTGNMYREKMTT